MHCKSLLYICILYKIKKKKTIFIRIVNAYLNLELKLLIIKSIQKRKDSVQWHVMTVSFVPVQSSTHDPTAEKMTVTRCC